MILSIDIGIRNLSFCAMSCQQPRDLKTYVIHLWDTFDTLEDDDRVCLSPKKDGQPCGRKCSLKYSQDETLVFTCKVHFPKNISPGKVNVFKKKLIKDYPLQEIARTVIDKTQWMYDTYPSLFEQMTGIVIELQPKINQKMKFVSHLIYGKFTDLLRHRQVPISFVRASAKLKAYKGPPIECALKGGYAKRKWLGEQYAKWFLENEFSPDQKPWLDVLETHAKKNDMTDTFLMSINALRKK